MHLARHDWISLALWILGSFAAGAVGAIASTRAPQFYAELEKPRWAPPARAFGPVWSVLYLLMGIAAWFVWRAQGWSGGARLALSLFVVQLALNALWTWLFFVLHRGALAFAELLLLLLVVAVTALLFTRIEPIAGLLLVPYLIWLGVAMALNHAVWRDNPTLL
ncbi:MAG: tryptophan-rich sensory protein [Gemmatimonadaceae bacterium]|nr:tryptophan-rich sensory protein [Gemmatimonadaceae bacterium]